jgi:hypothetical protein
VPRLPLTALVLAAAVLPGCAVEQAEGQDPTPSAPVAVRADTLAGVARRIYHQEAGGAVGRAAIKRIARDPALLAALNSGRVVPGELYRQSLGVATADDAFSDRGLRARLGGADPASTPDADALRAFGAFGADLGAFLAPWTDILSADAVVVSGGIAAAFALFGPALESVLAVALRAGELGVAAGLIGAARALNGGVRRIAEPDTLNVG